MSCFASCISCKWNFGRIGQNFRKYTSSTRNLYLLLKYTTTIFLMKIVRVEFNFLGGNVNLLCLSSTTD